MLYQEGRYQGDPVTLGVGGFGRVELVGVSSYLSIGKVLNVYYKPCKGKTGDGCTQVSNLQKEAALVLFLFCICCILPSR